MFAFRVIDGNIISEAEYRSKREELADFMQKRAAGNRNIEVALSSGRRLTALTPVAVEPIADYAPTAAGADIGKGKPCAILIREVYTGEYPHSGWFGGGAADVAIVSGVKSFEATNATARALNFIQKNVKASSRLERPSAFSNGTSVVAYSPAVLTNSWTLSFEFGIASFPSDFVNSIANAIGTVAQIPMMIPYTGYLLGAGQLLKLAGNIGHALSDGIAFSLNVSIDFDMLGTDPAVAGFRIISPYDFEGAGYTYSPKTGVTRDGKRYDGPGPYIVISLDGRENDNLKGFAPLAASAEVLQRFFTVPDGGQVAIDAIVDGLKFVSDYKYRQQAVELQQRLADPNIDQATKDRLKSQLDATLKNILSDALKPK
jgi:hypothetical protein